MSEPEKVRKVNDHLVDCLRYMLFSKPSAPEEEVTPRKTIFPAVFELKMDPPTPNLDRFEEIDIPSFYDEEYNTLHQLEEAREFCVRIQIHELYPSTL